MDGWGERFLAWLVGPDGKVILAGAAGGLLRWMTLKSNWKDGLIAIGAGGLCAYYLGPLALPAMNAVLGQVVVDESNRQAFSGFIIGVGGIGVTAFILDVWEAVRRKARRTEADPPRGLD